MRTVLDIDNCKLFQCDLEECRNGKHLYKDGFGITITFYANDKRHAEERIDELLSIASEKAIKWFNMEQVTGDKDE